MTLEQIEKQMWVNYDEGYKAGCSETINKAYEWLKKSTILADTTIERFKKTMEEQQ